MAKMGFLDTFRSNRLTKHTLGAKRTFLVAKIFYIPLPQYISKSLGTLTQKVGNFPNPPPNGPLWWRIPIYIYFLYLGYTGEITKVKQQPAKLFQVSLNILSEKGGIILAC